MSLSLQQQLQNATADLLKPSGKSAKSLQPLVAVATVVTGLVGGSAAMAAQQPGDWEFRTATLVYAESNRVQAIEPVLQATRYFENDRSLSTKLVLDSLTGASANGAVPSDQAQTFTRPSGGGRFTTAPGETPLDDTFRDTRVALSGSWNQMLFGLRSSFGLYASNEYDYFSFGANTLLNYDFNGKNSTLSLGLSYSSDSIEPEGGIPTPGAEANYHRGDPGTINNEFDDDSERNSRNSSEDKTVLDLLLGFTQVIDRSSLLQFNYSMSQSDGYITDPFKFVSVVDPSSGQPLRQLYENRPDSRSKQALYTQYKRSLRDTDVLDVSYRYLWDDWGLSSHTVDLRYLIGFGKHFIEPHLRFYSQEAVDFYTPFLVDGETVPVDLSADYRVGNLTGITAGLEYGQRMKSGSQWRLALEYYLQSSDEPANKPGQLANQEINPDVDAVMLRLNYDFNW
ncbi:MAG: DUF3570 domain-containing protein [Oceanococcus sp.]